VEGFDLIRITPFEDERGYLKKVYKKDLAEEHSQLEEAYILYSCKDSVRGNHYHKLNIEYFFVVHGTVKVAVKNINTGFYDEIEVDEKDNLLIAVHPFIAHAFKNEKEKELIILVVATKQYDPADNDTYRLEILE